MFSKARTRQFARELQTRGSGRRGYYLSTDCLPGLTQVESSVEGDAVYVATLDPRVQSAVPQPCSYELNTGTRFDTQDELKAWAASNGIKPSIYTPDFLITLKSGETLILETRHTRFLAQSGEKLFLAQRHLHSVGIRFVLATENEITHAVGRNARMLVSCMNRPVGDLTARLDTVGAVFTGGTLLSNGFTDLEILHLIATGALRADLRRPLTKRSELRRATDKTHLELLPL